MPRYYMPDEYDSSFRALDEFTRGYIECLFFTDHNEMYSIEEWDTPQAQDDIREGRCGGSLPSDVGFTDLAPETLERIKMDCADFQRVYAALLEGAYEKPGFTKEIAGSCFWFNRNGHGTGFWDRGLGDVGDELSDACGFESREKEHPFDSLDAYWGDGGKVYL